MPRIALRIVVLLLIPALLESTLATNVFAETFQSGHRISSVDAFPLLDQQALADRSLAERQEPYKGFKSFWSLLRPSTNLTQPGHATRSNRAGVSKFSWGVLIGNLHGGFFGAFASSPNHDEPNPAKLESLRFLSWAALASAGASAILWWLRHAHMAQGVHWVLDTYWTTGMTIFIVASAVLLFSIVARASLQTGKLHVEPVMAHGTMLLGMAVYLSVVMLFHVWYEPGLGRWSPLLFGLFAGGALANWIEARTDAVYDYIYLFGRKRSPAIHSLGDCFMVIGGVAWGFALSASSILVLWRAPSLLHTAIALLFNTSYGVFVATGMKEAIAPKAPEVIFEGSQWQGTPLDRYMPDRTIAADLFVFRTPDDLMSNTRKVNQLLQGVFQNQAVEVLVISDLLKNAVESVIGNNPFRTIRIPIKFELLRKVNSRLAGPDQIFHCQIKQSSFAIPDLDALKSKASDYKSRGSDALVLHGPSDAERKNPLATFAKLANTRAALLLYYRKGATLNTDLYVEIRRNQGALSSSSLPSPSETMAPAKQRHQQPREIRTAT